MEKLAEIQKCCREGSVDGLEKIYCSVANPVKYFTSPLPGPKGYTALHEAVEVCERLCTTCTIVLSHC